VRISSWLRCRKSATFLRSVGYNFWLLCDSIHRSLKQQKRAPKLGLKTWCENLNIQADLSVRASGTNVTLQGIFPFMQLQQRVSPPLLVFLAALLLVPFAYWLAWKASALFEVHANVSALYFSAGLTVAIALLWGWILLPLVLLALVLLQRLTFPEFALADIYWLGLLRQVAVYGIAGLFLRRFWPVEPFRLSLRLAMRFLLIAFVASLVSAALAIFIPPFDSLPIEVRQEVFLSFWGGDFAGVMITVPLIIILRTLTQLRLFPARNFPGVVQRVVSGELSNLSLVLAAIAVTLFAAGLPALMSSPVRLEMLTLLPVLIAGLTRGALAAFATALLVTCILVFAPPLLGWPIQPSVELQLLIVMNAAVALLAGAAHDDRQHEWQHANFDILTGLANRHRFEDRLTFELARATRSGRTFALMYVDLDGFKAVNDSLGHRVGDRLLTQVAVRLSGGVRATDTVARLGGDEFAIILADIESGAMIEELGTKLLRSIHRPYELGGDVANVSASIGVAFFPHDGKTPVALMHAADQAMYAAKTAGKNRLICFSQIPIPIGSTPFMA